MAPALAYLERDLEKDLSPVNGLTVECAKCDPDNPRAVPRAQCPVCKGAGRSLVALPTIIEELKESRLEFLVGAKKEPDEYFDPDDCCD